MDDIEMMASANQMWRESGTSLNFANWLEREKLKGRFIPNKAVKDSIATIRQLTGIEKAEVSGTVAKNDTIVGLNKWIVISAAGLIAVAIVYNVYQNRK